MKKEINVLSSWFCIFVFPTTISILRGGEGGEEKCYDGGVPSAVDRSLPSNFDKLEGNIEILRYKRKKNKRYELIAKISNSLHRVFVSVPFLNLSNLEHWNIATNKYKTEKRGK